MVMEDKQGGSSHMVLVGDLTVSGKGASGGVELTGKIGCVIRPCWVPTHFHQGSTGRLGLVSYREGSRVWGDVGVYHSPSRGTEVTLFWDSPACGLQPVLHPVSGSRPLS